MKTITTRACRIVCLILILLGNTPLYAGADVEPVPRIARYAGDRAAAASFTFDDGPQSHAGIARTFDSYGIKATFFVVAGWVPDAPEVGPKARLSWPELRAMALSGHEIGSHSMTHVSLQNITNEETLVEEIDSSFDRIAKGTGKAPVSFAYPFCKSNPTVRERVMRRYVAARGYHPLYEGKFSASQARQWIDKALTDGGWHVYLSHGIDNDALRAHLDDIVPLRDRLWIAPYGEVAAYCSARDKAVLTVITRDASRCSFTLTLPEGSSEILSRTPLTVVIPASGSTPSSPVACDPPQRALALESRTDSVVVILLPGRDPVTVSWQKPAGV